jgi:hypothetical protein
MTDNKKQETDFENMNLLRLETVEKLIRAIKFINKADLSDFDFSIIESSLSSVKSDIDSTLGYLKLISPEQFDIDAEPIITGDQEEVALDEIEEIQEQPKQQLLHIPKGVIKF